jgi:sugar phosphate isomerase/epimerase
LAPGTSARAKRTLGNVNLDATDIMKFAICNETFADWPLERALAFAAECGYTGIEIAPFTLADDVSQITAARRAEVRRLADASGLEVVGLHWLLAKTEGLHVTSPDAEVRRRTAGYLAELARCCAEMGGKILVFGSPKQRSLLPGVAREAATDYAADVFEQLLPTLEETETVVALEPLGLEETDFLTTAAEAVRLAERLGSPQVRLHLDCKAMSTETTPAAELVERFGRLLAHFHANDPNRQGPGFGTLDFLPILSALGRIDYGGWVSVEVFDYSPGVEVLARRSIDYLQNCLLQLANCQ